VNSNSFTQLDSKIDYAEHRSIKINNVDYVYLSAGEKNTTAPLIIFLHGFPDNAYSWEHQIVFFQQQGYRVVAPFLRGYAPTRSPNNAYFDRASIANDVANFIEKFNQNQPVFLVGQDWGAAIGYGLLGAFPEKIKRACLLAIPHPVEIRKTLKRSPKQVIRSFHWFLFQIPKLPELLIRFKQGAFLRLLWRLWSPNFSDDKHVQQVISSMLANAEEKDGQLKYKGIQNALAYYRAAIQKKFRDPKLSHVFADLNNVITTPIRVLCGTKDMRSQMLDKQEYMFAEEANYNWHSVPDSGHFLHREQPEVVNQLIKDWFEQD